MGDRQNADMFDAGRAQGGGEGSTGLSGRHDIVDDKRTIASRPGRHPEGSLHVGFSRRRVEPRLRFGCAYSRDTLPHGQGCEATQIFRQFLGLIEAARRPPPSIERHRHERIEILRLV